MQEHHKEHLYESLHSQIYRGKYEWQPAIFKQLKGEFPSPEAVARFHREYQLTRKLGVDLKLEGVIQVFSLDKEQNTWVITMEDFGGESLAFHLKKQKFSLDCFLPLAIQLSQTLDYVHQAQIIHKDINPSNIIWNAESGQVKLIDFGISAELSQENPSLQAPEQLEGTLSYMSPEQTGRMNRPLDSRSDLYSLGVSFYHILTGKLPFPTEDPLEIIHSHLAIPPVPAHELSPEIPEILSQILSKLMFKNSEDRYQSAYGLLMDLQRCQNSLSQSTPLVSFELGLEERLEQFRFPQHLFGRDQEIEILQEMMERVHQGGREIVWITGSSGIGKSSLVKEVNQWVMQSRGYFVSGKFDQINQGRPYSSLIQAFRQLVQQLLTESSEKLAVWKEKLLMNLEGNGQLILDVIPEVQLIIGVQPKVLQVSATQARNRFQFAFQNFICAFASPDHPLVLFLDDLQWVDSASLDLLVSIFEEQAENSIQGFCFLGAYRDQEVDELFLGKWRGINQEAMHQETLKLSPLQEKHITELLRETFHCSHDLAHSLGQVVQEKTDGNPFFIQQFLAILVKNGEIYFDRKKKGWAWELEKIAKGSVTGNVVQLLTDKIHELPSRSQDCLKLAACIGNEFDFHTLGLVGEIPHHYQLEGLGDLLQEGLLIPLDENYKYGGVGNPHYRFVHDRVQQAAYSLFSEIKKQEVHKKIGLYFLEKLTPEELDLNLFEVVEHWNLGSSLFQEKSHIALLTDLNFQAGKKAKQAVAYERAFLYLKQAVKFLPADAWNQDSYSQTFQIYLQAAEAAFLIQDEETMNTWLAEAFKHTQDTFDCLRLETIRVQAYIVAQKYQEAIQIGFDSLKQALGVRFPKKATQLHIVLGYLKATRQLRFKSEEELLEVPLVTDPNLLDAFHLMEILGPVVYISNPNFFPLLIFQGIDFIFRYGNSIQTGFNYLTLGMFHCINNRFQEGQRLVDLSTKILARHPSREIETKNFVIQYALVGSLHYPLNTCIGKSEEGAKLARQVGDFEFLGYHLESILTFPLFQGTPLEQVKKKCEYVKKQRKINNHTKLIMRLTKEVQLSWQQASPSAPVFCQRDFQSGELEEIKEKKDVHFLSYFFFFQMQFYYGFMQDELALEAQKEARKYLGSPQGIFILVGNFLCFETLTLLRSKPTFYSLKTRYQIQKNRKQLKLWAQQFPLNYSPLHLLVEAEFYRFEQHVEKAQNCYQKAVESARKGGFLQLEALANELAGQFYLERLPWLSQIYLKQARHCYQLWGAIAKVKQLELLYPILHDTSEEKIQFNSVPLNLVEKSPRQSTFTQGETLSNTLRQGTGDFDRLSVTKASQAISSEIELEQLCKTLLEIMLESAGAEKALLLMEFDNEDSSSFLIRAEARTKQSANYFTEGILPKECDKLSISILRYALQTQDPLILEDAIQDSRFQNDSYLIQNQIRSVFCLPIIQKQKLVAIAYFENNLISGAFPQERVEMLEMLSSQAAISLENARKHRELQETQGQLVQSEKMAGLGVLVSGVGHEMRNPLSAVSVQRYNLEEKLHQFHKTLLGLMDDSSKEDLQFLQDQFDPFFRALNIIEEGNLRLQSIVGNLQNFSRMDRGGEFRKEDPVKALNSTLQLIRAQYDHQVEFECQFSLAPMIPCLLGSLNQVFLNLIVNASQAILNRQKNDPDAPSGKLILSTEIEDSFLCIHFQDNGCGMSQAVKQKVFAPFFTTKPVGEGTGLGMYISHKIITQHHGKINVQSVQGEGTTITIFLPL